MSLRERVKGFLSLGFLKSEDDSASQHSSEHSPPGYGDASLNTPTFPRGPTDVVLQRRLLEAKRERDESNKELTKLRKYTADLQTQIQDLDKEVRTKHDNASYYRDKAHQYAEHIAGLEANIKAFNAEYHRLHSQHQILGREHASLQNTLNDKEALYATQSLELRTAQTYLNTADSVPGARVIQAVRDLNSEIQSAAAMFAEELQFSPPPDSKAFDSDDFRTAVFLLKDSGGIGEHLRHALSTRDNSEDPTLVQTAVQGLLVSESERCISSFFREDGAAENVVKGLHGVIRQNEVQAVSGRWRALSARYLRLNSQDPSNSGLAAAEALSNPLTALFVVSRCVSPLEEIRRVIANKFASKLCTIASQALALGTVIHEDVTSTDYEVIHVAAKTPFDPTVADDDYADNDADSPPTQPILCTLELGLRQVTVAESNGPKGGKEQMSTLLLKPKIALESAIDMMFAS